MTNPKQHTCCMCEHVGDNEDFKTDVANNQNAEDMICEDCYEYMNGFY